MESLGLVPTGELRQLNSYENRVFELFLESPPKGLSDHRVVTKFYRPGRWSKESIQEEHDFLAELKDNDVPVVAPLVLDGKTLHESSGMLLTVFPKIHGRMPDEILPNEAFKVGVLLAQVHSIGQRTDFKFRPEMGSTPYTLWENLDLLKDHVSVEMWPRYEQAAIDLIETFEDTVDLNSFQRIHADFHRGNLLSNKDGFMLVDFDDCLMGPIVQDFWMLLQGLEEEDKAQLIKGYESLREFPDYQMEWIPLLRGVRILNYASWIARRWQDPSFPKIFPQFGTYNYWAEETEAIESILRDS
jgi:Ser/Thr protein kinase RdoA (MazF antagonist)